MRLDLSISLGMCLCCLQTFAQPQSISFESLDSLQKQTPRPIVVFLHTKWCKYCDTMKNTTFRNERIIEQLDTSYYFVSFDGESDEDVTFLGRTFSYKPSGNQTGIHELAEQLGTKNGSVTYPSLIFLNKQFNILYQHDGFLSATALSKILQNLLNTAY